MAKKKDGTLTATQGESPARGYTVLARRYRSRDFEELVGQEPISRTLKNAIESGRTAHAYLFCGTRGVGKTSMARIFAKALNVAPELKEGQAVADAILRGDDLDVIEIDGASNRGIDQARELIANAGLSPSRCRYKIYIIDEVHMLTKDAFNALLKTMEEPPSHVKFVLCTTEPHKVPMTIQSRCQRFEFRALSTARIAEQLRRIVVAEGIAADDAALHLLARLGNGSMRDALSLLDRVLSTGETTLAVSVLEEVLGLPDQTLVIRLTNAITSSDVRTALEVGAELLARGSSIEQTLEVMIHHFRELMVLAACGGDSELVELTDGVRAEAQAQTAHFDAPGLVHIIAMCDAVARSVRSSSASRALFDALLVRLCLAEHLASIPALLSGASLPPSTSTTRTVAAAEKKNEPGQASKHETLTREISTPARSAVAELKPPVLLAKNVSAEELWSRVLARASAQSDKAKLEHLTCESYDGVTARLVLESEGAGMSAFLRTQTAWLSSLLEGVAGRPVKVELKTPNVLTAAPMMPEEQIGEASRIPIVRRAMDLFDATIVAVQAVTPLPQVAKSSEENTSRV